jgi:hypothetical protein
VQQSPFILWSALGLYGRAICLLADMESMLFDVHIHLSILNLICHPLLHQFILQFSEDFNNQIFNCASDNATG